MPQMHYWITGIHNGEPFLYYGGPTEQDANTKGYQIIDCYFDVVALPTRDINAASRMLKGKKLADTGNLDSSLAKLKHKL